MADCPDCKSDPGWYNGLEKREPCPTCSAPKPVKPVKVHAVTVTIDGFEMVSGFDSFEQASVAAWESVKGDGKFHTVTMFGDFTPEADGWRIPDQRDDGESGKLDYTTEQLGRLMADTVEGLAVGHPDLDPSSDEYLGVPVAKLLRGRPDYDPALAAVNTATERETAEGIEAAVEEFREAVADHFEGMAVDMATGPRDRTVVHAVSLPHQGRPRDIERAAQDMALKLGCSVDRARESITQCLASRDAEEHRELERTALRQARELEKASALPGCKPCTCKEHGGLGAATCVAHPHNACKCGSPKACAMVPGVCGGRLKIPVNTISRPKLTSVTWTCKHAGKDGAVSVSDGGEGARYLLGPGDEAHKVYPDGAWHKAEWGNVPFNARVAFGIFVAQARNTGVYASRAREQIATGLVTESGAWDTAASHLAIACSVPTTVARAMLATHEVRRKREGRACR